VELKTSGVAKSRGEPFFVAGWHIDPASLRISKNKHTIKLEPKAMAVLDYLACRAGSVVSRQELEATVWEGTIVGYDALSNAIIKLRKALGDKARKPHIIETIAKSGYQLIAEISFEEPAQSSVNISLTAPVLPVVSSILLRRWVTPLIAASILGALVSLYALVYQDDKPSIPTGPKIAVIPFNDLTGNPDDAYFGAGLTKDINAQLSKFSNFFVFAPGSVSSFRNNPDCKTVRNELAADYILGGTVQRSLNKLRVTTTFTDAETCRQLDAPGPFDRDLSVDNVLDIQLEIAKKVVAQVGSADAPLFNANIQNEIRDRAPDNLEAYQCVLLSYWFYETFESDRHRKARACLENAVKLDAEYSLGWSRLAFSYIETKKYAIDTPEDWAKLSRDAAYRAIDLDPDNPDAYYALAILTQMTSQDQVEFQNFAERVIELNPNDAFVLADLGTWMGYAGQWELAKSWVSRSMQLNPKHQSWLWQTWHLDHFLKGEYKESRDYALKMNLPNNYMVQASLTAAYAMNGEQENSEKTLARVFELRPNYADDPRAPFRARGMSVELIEKLMDGLRIAGLEVIPAE